MPEMSNVEAIKKFFTNVTMAELKALSVTERQELGDMIREFYANLEIGEYRIVK